MVEGPGRERAALAVRAGEPEAWAGFNAADAGDGGLRGPGGGEHGLVVRGRGGEGEFVVVAAGEGQAPPGF